MPYQGLSLPIAKPADTPSAVSSAVKFVQMLLLDLLYLPFTVRSFPCPLVNLVPKQSPAVPPNTLPTLQ